MGRPCIKSDLSAIRQKPHIIATAPVCRLPLETTHGVVVLLKEWPLNARTLKMLWGVFLGGISAQSRPAWRTSPAITCMRVQRHTHKAWSCHGYLTGLQHLCPCDYTNADSCRGDRHCREYENLYMSSMMVPIGKSGESILHVNQHSPSQPGGSGSVANGDIRLAARE